MHRRFSPLGTARDHFWLTLGMARSLGVNLTDALQRGDLGRGDYADLVTQCRGCDAARACVVWMGQQTDIAARAPDFCANQAAYGGLQDRAARTA